MWFVFVMVIRMMRHGSLFSGIGGFDLAATWMGWENVFHCEKDRFCRRVLKYYWPNTRGYEDIKEFSAIEYRGGIDVISGGFPCQPFSQAGKRQGTADSRYLWPQMLRVVDEIQPPWVVGENVFGLVNWEGGMVFRKVLTNLETQGYEVWPVILPAAGVGAPHQRNRIFFVASRTGRFDGKFEWRKYWSSGNAPAKNDPAADANGDKRREGGMHEAGPQEAERHPGARDAWDARYPWQHFPTESPLCGGTDGLSHELDRITFSAWRKESLKAYGNAIVPQVAWRIFRVIERIESEMWDK